MNVDRFLAHYDCLDAALEMQGFKPTLPWWRETIERFYRSGKRRLVVRKGRRVYASTQIAPRLAVVEMLWGEHEHIKGSPPLNYAFLSVKKEEAANRLLGVAAILDAIGVEHSVAGMSIKLTDRPALFSVVTANHKTNVGGTIAFAWLDEVSRWSDDELGANPAELVVTSLAPALQTLPNAKMFLVSSPMTVDDFHARQFDLGETGNQCVAFGATWDIRPDFTEEMARKEEPDERTMLREYGAIPTTAITKNWFGEAIERAVTDIMPRPTVYVRPLFAIDPAFDGDTSPDLFGWAACTNESLKGERTVWLRGTGAWKPDRKPSEMAKLVREEVCNVYDPKHASEKRVPVYSDQYEGHSFSELAGSEGINLLVEPWTGGAGEDSQFSEFKSVRLGMLQGTVKIPNDPELLRELRSVTSIVKNGTERIVVPRTASGHCDRVMAAMKALSLALKRSPTAVDVAPEKTEQQKMREAAELAVIKKRKEEMRRNPMGAMRRAR